jgi:hypothetical protein
MLIDIDIELPFVATCLILPECIRLEKMFSNFSLFKDTFDANVPKNSIALISHALLLRFASDLVNRHPWYVELMMMMMR